ncbi:hypothetical protein RRF57_003283 [Xylaria bambusicola]|uniref:Ricin B lectin domain-containing protein n=1 Tax=Xylaria bambusicola TaxID=326684 RepID=A0AAN7UEV3_9PEZI
MQTKMNFLWFASLIHVATQSPVLLDYRTVAQLDQSAFDEAQQPDTSATKAFASTLIKASSLITRTADGRCLFVDKLSGDFRANLTPVQIAECGSTDGQEWDIITNGKHNNVGNSILVVSTLTNACLNFDPRRPAGNQVILFSCGGRADGGGDVTDSQLFPFNGGAGPLSLSPENDPDSCLAVSDEVIDIAPCVAGDLHQLFNFGDSLSLDPNSTSTDVSGPSTVITTTDGSSATITSAATSSTSVAGIANPTEAVPVSGAGGVLQPSAVAEAHQRDDTATRAFESISIQSPDGRCLFIDPTAGDFRENLIPVSLVQCAGTPNEKFDVITAGKHNNEDASALIVSSLMNGCISFDGRREAGDTVTIFSCGGRADGDGETNSGQLIPFTGGTQFALAPVSERNATCIVPGNDRLDSAPCTDDDSQLFKVLT